MLLSLSLSRVRSLSSFLFYIRAETAAKRALRKMNVCKLRAARLARKRSMRSLFFGLFAGLCRCSLTLDGRLAGCTSPVASCKFNTCPLGTESDGFSVGAACVVFTLRCAREKCHRDFCASSSAAQDSSYVSLAVSPLARVK